MKTPIKSVFVPPKMTTRSMKYTIFINIIFGCCVFFCMSCSERQKNFDQLHFSDNYDNCVVDTVNHQPVLHFSKSILSAGQKIKIESSYPANELLVRLTSNTSRSQFYQYIRQQAQAGNILQISDSVQEDSIYAIHINSVTSKNLKDASQHLMQSKLFKYSVPNYIFYGYYNQHNVGSAQWSLYNTTREEGFDADIDGAEAISQLLSGQALKEITVAVIDEGIDIFHEAFKDALWKNPAEVPNNNKDDDRNGLIDDINGWNFVSGSNTLIDNSSHGNHVSGIIAARATRGGGLLGIACHNAKIMTCKTGEKKQHKALDIVKALNYALKMRADVINMSLGSHDQSPPLEDAIRKVLDANIPVVAAAGNDGADIYTYPTYPASYMKVIAVANTNVQDSLATTSNYSRSMVRIAAPGENIFSCLQGNSFGTMSGTSMAAPHVTGAIALLKGLQPNLDVLAVIKALDDGADVIPGLATRVYNGQRLNVYRTLFQAKESTDGNGVTYQNQLVGGHFRNSLTPYANFREPNVDGKSYQTAFKITSMQQLLNIRDSDLNSHFRIMNNLDWNSVHPSNRSTIAKTFNGKLYGDGFTIKNFNLQTGYPTGLFLKLGPDAAMYNLKFACVNVKGNFKVGVVASEIKGSLLSNVQIEGTIIGEGSVGGLAGEAYGAQINNCFFEGKIISTTDKCGGIVGIGDKTNLLRCHVQAKIRGQKDCGGIAGYLEGNIEECYSCADVNGNKNVGGLVGNASKCKIQNCYTEGNVRSLNSAGGLVGNLNECLLTHDYSLCTVDKQMFCGGLLGNGRSFSVQKCYFLDNGSNPSGIGGIGISSVQIQNEENFLGWFPSAIWRIAKYHSPALNALPRSFGSIYRQTMNIEMTSNASSSRKHSINQPSERMIWRFGNYPLTTSMHVNNVELTLTSDDLMSISFTVDANGHYTKKGYHPWFKLKIYDIDGHLIVEWPIFKEIPITCSTNQTYTKSITIPGVYNRAYKGDFSFPVVPYPYCN